MFILNLIAYLLSASIQSAAGSPPICHLTGPPWMSSAITSARSATVSTPSLKKQISNRTFEQTFGRDTGFSLRTLLNVAIEHRLMHTETLSYMLHQLPLNTKVRPRAQQAVSPNNADPPVAHRMVNVPAGVVTLGLARDAEDFGWDNEYEAHTVEVPAFEIDQYKVTNRQYLEFMAAEAMRRALSGTTMTGTGRLLVEFLIRCFGEKDGDRWLLPHDVRRSAVRRSGAGLARVCESGGGRRLRALGREVASHRSGVAARRLRHRRRKCESLSVGQ